MGKPKTKPVFIEVERPVVPVNELNQLLVHLAAAHQICSRYELGTSDIEEAFTNVLELDRSQEGTRHTTEALDALSKAAALKAMESGVSEHLAILLHAARIAHPDASWIPILASMPDDSSGQE